MRELFDKLKIYLKENKIDGLYFNSSNEFLMEYNVLELNSSFKLTNFSGSTSMGVATKDKVYLFVDTRYHAQADIEVRDDFIEIVKVPLDKYLYEAMFEVLGENFVLGVPAKKISKFLFDKFKKEGKPKNIKFKPLNEDGIEVCESSLSSEKFFDINEIPLEISGKSADDKISELLRQFQNSYLLVTDLTDIAYLTNLRSFDFPYSSSFPSKLIINPSGATLYVNSEREFKSKFIKTKFFDEYYKDLKNIKNSDVLYQKKSISLYDFRLIDKSNKKIDKDFSRKHIKNNSEIEHFKECFYNTDRALEIIEQMLSSEVEYSEFDYSRALVDSLYSNGAYALSFKPIVACGENSAIIHYGTPSKDKIVKDGDFLLIDYGAYFEGGYATDTTRTFIKGTPSDEQKKVYTVVLKAFLNAYHKPTKKYYNIDNNARKVIEKGLGTEYPFAHGTGHGVGISVHEPPVTLSKHKLSKVDITENTVFSIEPGAYKQGFGGVRLENTVYANKLNDIIMPETLSKYKFEDKLVDRSLLTKQEFKWYLDWQEEYERTYLSK
ncbi:M24 family metallopeptidase [bacterium]|nr:M24 family metallopeptidase [bacterium]